MATDQPSLVSSTIASSDAPSPLLLAAGTRIVPATVAMELARAVSATRPAAGPARRCPQAKPRTAAPQPAGRRPSRAQRLQPVHAAATAQAEGLSAWLAAAGVDAAKQAVAPAAAGLVCTRPVKAGEQLFAVPAAAWITAETATQSDIGQHLQGCVGWSEQAH